MVDTLRDLARKLGMLKDCVCLGKPITIYQDDRPLVEFPCVLKCGDGKRLPTEAEVRAVIFEAGWPVIVARIESDYVSLEVWQPSEQRDAAASAADGTADLVLLALLRALEVCRG